MVKRTSKTFQMRADNTGPLCEQLLKYDIEPERSGSGLSFEMQSGNVVYTVDVIVVDSLPEDARLFAIGAWPNIRTFADIQMQIFGKVLWR